MDTDDEIETKLCTKCNKEKEMSKFGILTQKDGTIRYKPQCKECRNSANKTKSNKRKETGTKYCPGCDEDHPVKDFSGCKLNSDGLQTYCKIYKTTIAKTHFSTLDGYLVKLFATLRHNAKKRNIPVEITLDDIKELYKKQDGKCAISNIQMTHLAYQSDDPKQLNKNNLSIDRKDSKKGYTKTNIQLVCTIINILKTDLNENEMLLLLNDIYKHNNQ